MFGWLKNLFGGDTPDTPEIAKVAPVKAATATAGTAKATTKKAPAKKATKKASVDLDSMNKRDLLAHAKTAGVKANASMNKDAIIKAIKNG